MYHIITRTHHVLFYHIISLFFVLACLCYSPPPNFCYLIGEEDGGRNGNRPTREMSNFDPMFIVYATKVPVILPPGDNIRFY